MVQLMMRAESPKTSKSVIENFFAVERRVCKAGNSALLFEETPKPNLKENFCPVE